MSYQEKTGSEFINSRSNFFSAYAGLALVYVIQTLTMTQYAVRKTSEVEPKYEEERTPPQDWPWRKSIVMRDVSLTYYPGEPQVLKNISLSVKGGAKIGVVGRTGAGKLICLARVLLQRSKIVVLDEPTAHVDPDTEQTIWNVVRDKLKESTVITIAHRLNTIKDCEKILVLKDGKVKGFDKFD